MDSLSYITDIITLVISLFLFFRNVKRFTSAYRYIIYLIVFLLYVVPLFIDCLYGHAYYEFSLNRYYGFYVSRRDIWTTILYNVFIVLLQMSLLYSNKNKASSWGVDPKPIDAVNSRNVRILLYVGLFLPTLLAILYLKRPELLYSYGWRELHLMDIPPNYGTVEQLTYLAITCSILLIFEKGKKTLSFQKIIALVFLYPSICIEGKRAILFYAIVCIVILIYMNFVGRVQAKRGIFSYVAAGSIGILLLVLYMVSVSVSVKVERGYAAEDTDVMLTTQRIDFFRDDRVRMAIYSEIHPEKMQILDYHGETIIPVIFKLYPLRFFRDALGIEKATYQTHFSCALDGTRFSDTDSIISTESWMTVSFFADFLSNFGLLLGFILILYLCNKFSSIVERLNYPYNYFSIFAFTLISLFDIAYVMLYLEIVVIFYLIDLSFASDLRRQL